eukprot:TRINITY_DN8800_c0_g1_i3.p1 TRINITY_DN8800_c0_g1~~TRINITY_DN8800_c0_g1_i3.p1  ORF type:complete len:135 (-),score=30.38 TRINITY_DN8800_c0_g1_i3:219-623(-)
MEPAVWEWSGDGQWVQYDIKTSAIIEDYYNGGQVLVPLNHDFFGRAGGYCVDLSQMVQINQSTGNQRSIRRNPAVPPLRARTHFRKHQFNEVELELIKSPRNIEKELKNTLSLFHRRDPGTTLDPPIVDIVIES